MARKIRGGEGAGGGPDPEELFNPENPPRRVQVPADALSPGDRSARPRSEFKAYVDRKELPACPEGKSRGEGRFFMQRTRNTVDVIEIYRESSGQVTRNPWRTLKIGLGEGSTAEFRERSRKHKRLYAVLRGAGVPEEYTA